MVITHALKMRIYPNKKQSLKIDKTIDCCRYVYNHMLYRNQKVYERRGEHLSYYDMQNLLPKMKEYLPWLKDSDSQALKYVCRQVNNAYDKFFKKQNKFPRFKSKRNTLQSYTTTNASAIHYQPKEVSLPCLGKMKCSDKRTLPENSKICYCTISKRNDKYYCSITYKYEKDVISEPINENQVIGLDYKSNGLFVDSDGNVASMPHFFRKAQSKLIKQERKLSHMIKTHIIGYKNIFGKRYPIYDKNLSEYNRLKRQIRKVAKLQEIIANQRKDYLHKLSAQMSNTYDAIVVEDLNMKAISNSDFGNGKATMDNAYGLFTTFLEYKLLERGKQLIKVDKFFPSTQMCSNCGSIKKIPLSQRVYQCDCGLMIDRDLNSAINIKNEGLRLLTV